MDTFIKELKCSNGLFGVFEDDGETGYLYCYSPEEKKIYMDIIIYDHSLVKLMPLENDVQLAYDDKSNQCGVYVWGKLRGYIVFPDIERKRLKFSSPENPGIKTSNLPELYKNYMKK